MATVPVDMEQALPTRCPLCAGRIHVARVACEACGCGVDGEFSLGWLGQLSREQLAFVKVFVACRGKIKDVEQALGLSYPTVVSRLDDVVAAVGGPGSAPVAPAVERLEVLDELAAGSIDVDEAERRLKSRR